MNPFCPKCQKSMTLVKSSQGSQLWQCEKCHRSLSTSFNKYIPEKPEKLIAL